MSTVNMEGPPAGPDQMAMAAPGGAAPVNFRQGGAVQYFNPENANRVVQPDPRALQLFEEDKALFGSLLGAEDQQAALEEQKRMTKAQMLFDIAQGALAFATPGETAVSPAERLAQVAQPVLGNIGARSGELLKFKQGQAAEKRSLDMAALQSSQSKLQTEKQAKIDAAAADALAQSKSVAKAAEYTQQLLLQSNEFSYKKKQGETDQGYALRLAKDLADTRRTLKNMENASSLEQIELRNRLSAKEARLTESHDLVLQSNKFGQQTSERLSSEQFRTTLQNSIDAATASRQALGFKNDEKTIAQRGVLDKELTRLNSQLRITEKAVDLDNDLKILGVKDIYTLGQMEKGHEQDLALADHRGSISAMAAHLSQVATATENALDRAQREGLQINSQNFKLELQKDMQNFTGSEKEKDRLLTQIQNDVMNALKERGLDINERGLSIEILKNAAAESLALRKQTFVEAEAAADRLAPSFKVVEGNLVMYKPDGTATPVYSAPEAPLKADYKVIRDMSNQTTRVVDASTPSGLLAIEAANTANSGGTEQFRVSNMSADSAPTAKAYKVDGVGTRLSYDGGRTYINLQGQSVSMPTKAQPLSDTIAAAEAAKMRIQLRAGKDLAEMEEMLGIVSMGGTRDNPIPLNAEEAGLMRNAMEAARMGTGPYAGIAVALDSVFGGLIPQARQAFQDTQANRQFLRGVTILTRSALVVNPRFPVAEMERVGVLFPDPDAFFRDPETEANKFIELKRLALTQKMANNEALNEGIQDDKTRQSVLSNNFEIDRLLGMLGTVPLSIGGNVDSDTMEALRRHVLGE